MQSDNTIVKPGADLGLAICLRAKASIDSGHIDTVVYYRGFKVWKASKVNGAFRERAATCGNSMPRDATPALAPAGALRLCLLPGERGHLRSVQ